MTLRVILVSAALGAAALNGPARAQTDKQPVEAGTARYGDPTSIARIYQDYLYGVIKKITASEMVLEKTKFGVDQTFKFDRKVKFVRDGKPSSSDHMKVGDKVWVDVKTDKKTGELIAKKVITGLGAVMGP
jgi:hypothetical protein